MYLKKKYIYLYEPIIMRVKYSNQYYKNWKKENKELSSNYIAGQNPLKLKNLISATYIILIAY